MREVFREFVVAKRRDEASAEHDAVLAWCIGLRVGQAFAGKLPELKTVLSAKVQKQTVDEQRTQLFRLADEYGLPVRRKRKGKSKTKILRP